MDDHPVGTAHSDRLGDAASGPVVVLVGVPGAGKSTVGHALAQRLEVDFRDTDADVESTSGRAIADIFIDSGEPEFRRLEASAVATAMAEHQGVLALGGGAVIDAGTRALLAGASVVWLRVGLAAASQRAGLSGARPVLLGNVRAQMKALMDARAPLYAEVARLIVDTDALSVDEAVEAIVQGLGLAPHATSELAESSDGSASSGPSGQRDVVPDARSVRPASDTSSLGTATGATDPAATSRTAGDPEVPR